MMGDGLLKELQELVDRGLGEDVARANVIGYSELIEYLNGNLSLSEAAGNS